MARMTGGEVESGQTPSPEERLFTWMQHFYRVLLIMYKPGPLLKTFPVEEEEEEMVKYLWSCDYGTQKIYKHNIDATLSVAEEYDAPESSPAGLAWDGSNLWSGNWTPEKIYKHNMDATLSVAETYDPPAGDPWGITIQRSL